MKSIKTGLLLAAALALTPALVQAQDRDWHRGEHGGGDRGGRPGGGQHGGDRPAPPQAPRPPSPPSAPAPQGRAGGMSVGHGGPDGGNRFGGHPGGPNMPRPQWQGDRGNPNHGNWNGGNWNRGDARPIPPQAAPGVMFGGDRGQWRRDGQPAAPGNRDFRDGGHRPDSANRQWDNDGRRFEGNDRRWNDDGRRFDRNDPRWGNDGRRWDGNDRRFDNNRYTGHGYRPDLWRNDHRYDWRGWRNTHRDLFRGRYYAPRGLPYRSVYRGFYLEPFFYGSSYWLADPYEYRLPPVEWPLRWVRYYDDALLVDVTTGEVVDVIQDFFW